MKRTRRETRDGTKKEHIYPFIVIALDPRNQAQEGQQLRLHLKRNIIPFDDVVHSKWHSSPSPEHHHGGLKTDGIVSFPIDHNLRNQLFSHEFNGLSQSN
jgi:hypothetical protein